jgi:hypothetical protein
MSPKSKGVAKAKTTTRKAPAGAKKKQLEPRRKGGGMPKGTVPHDPLPVDPTLEAHLAAYARALRDTLEEMRAEVAALRAEVEELRSEHDAHRHPYSLPLFEGGAVWITLDQIRRWIEGDSFEEIFGSDPSEKDLLNSVERYGWYFAGKPSSGNRELVTGPPED